MLLRRSPQNPCYMGILAGEGGLRPTAPSALGFHVTDTYSRCRKTVSTVKKSHASRPWAWARRKARQDVSRPRGAGRYCRARRIRRTAASLIR